MNRVNREVVAAYLGNLLGKEVICEVIEPLGKIDREHDEKGYGYGVPLLIGYRHADAADATMRRVVLHTMKAAPFGHEHRSDRAAALLWSFDTFNKLPRHVRSLDVGGFCDSDETLVSLAKVDELFLLTDFVDGREYAADLDRLRGRGKLEAIDFDRADALCDYLVEIHQKRGSQGSLYRRRIRELIGDGECIMGLIDSYPADDPIFTPAALEQLESDLISWRWRLKRRTRRLRQVHGDFHPWNILFAEGAAFHVLDRSRGEWGEPADDVTCLTLNYLFESLQAHGGMGGPFRELFQRFWSRYLKATGDGELLEVAPPFVVFRALVMASPLWYPHLTVGVRRHLLSLCRSVLAVKSFDPQRIDEYFDER